MSYELLYNSLRRMKFSETEMLCQDLHIPEIYRGHPFVIASERDRSLGVIGRYVIPEDNRCLEIHSYENLGIRIFLEQVCGENIRNVQAFIPLDTLEQDCGYAEHMFERLEQALNPLNKF